MHLLVTAGGKSCFSVIVFFSLLVRWSWIYFHPSIYTRKHEKFFVLLPACLILMHSYLLHKLHHFYVYWYGFPFLPHVCSVLISISSGMPNHNASIQVFSEHFFVLLIGWRMVFWGFRVPEFTWIISVWNKKYIGRWLIRIGNRLHRFMRKKNMICNIKRELLRYCKWWSQYILYPCDPWNFKTIFLSILPSINPSSTWVSLHDFIAFSHLYFYVILILYLKSACQIVPESEQKVYNNFSPDIGKCIG